MAQEQSVFHALLKIKIFKQFRLWKPFYVWSATVKGNKFYSRVRGWV
jgi:hypothetical protein